MTNGYNNIPKRTLQLKHTLKNIILELNKTEMYLSLL